MTEPDQGQVVEVLDLVQTNTPSIRETWMLDPGTPLLIAAQYVVHSRPPEPNRDVHHDHDPVQGAIAFLAATLAAAGYWLKRRR